MVQRPSQPKTTRTRNCREAILQFLHNEGGVGAGWFSPDFICDYLPGSKQWTVSYTQHTLGRMYVAGEVLRRNMARGRSGGGYSYDYTLAPPGTIPPTLNDRAVTSGSRHPRTTTDYTHCQRIDCDEELPPRIKGKPGPPQRYCSELCKRYAEDDRMGRARKMGKKLA